MHLISIMLWQSDRTHLPASAPTIFKSGRFDPSFGGASGPTSAQSNWANALLVLGKNARIFIISHTHKRYLGGSGYRQCRVAPETRTALGGIDCKKESPYVASHAYAVDGYKELESEEFSEELIEFCTHGENIYSHIRQARNVLHQTPICITHWWVKITARLSDNSPFRMGRFGLWDVTSTKTPACDQPRAIRTQAYC